MKKNHQSCIEVLHKWAMLRSLVAHADQPQAASWEPVERISEAAQCKLSEDAERLKNLLERSSLSLSPLSDPLAEDFGVHRWLKGKREEVYSDWLAWVLEQLPKPEHIFKIFKIKLQKQYSGEVSVRRERWVPKGDEEEAGRIDLVVEVGDQWAMIIEVKMGLAELADTKKQRKYLRSKKAKVASTVLLALSGESQSYEGFKLRKWEDLCIQLRHMMPDLERAGLSVIQRTMILGFVGAVEQNILDFPGQLKLKLRRKYGMSSALEDYLRKCLNAEVFLCQDKL